jgi:hypothetical protein
VKTTMPTFLKFFLFLFQLLKNDLDFLKKIVYLCKIKICMEIYAR